jgi:hypothetical protein
MAHLKPGPPDWHRAAMHGDPPHVPGLHRRSLWIPSTLSSGMSLCQTSLGGLLLHLAKMGSAQWRHSLLAIRHVGWSCLRKKTTPPGLPGVQGYHVGGFSYIKQPLAILRSFIFYFLWSERCRKHFDNQYSSRKILQQAWVATVEVGMATWKAINSLRSTWDSSIQARIDQAFRVKWCHLSIFGDDCATIMWLFLPPLYSLHFFNVWWGCCLRPFLGVLPDPCGETCAKLPWSSDLLLK